MSSMNVLLFGPYAQAVGAPCVTVELAPPCSAATVMQALAEQVPALQPLLPSGRLAVNCQCVRADHPVTQQDELAVIGLVGGG